MQGEDFMRKTAHTKLSQSRLGHIVINITNSTHNWYAFEILVVCSQRVVMFMQTEKNSIFVTRCMAGNVGMT